VALYGSYGDERKLDWGQICCLLFYCVELVLKLVTYFPKEYWFYSSFAINKGKQQKEFAHRCDAIATLVSLILALALLFGKNGGHFDDLFRFALSIPTVRILILTRKTRKLFLVLSKIFPSFSALFILLLLVMYVYAVYGIYFFKDKLELAFQDQAPPGNFDTLANAFVVLFQLLTAAQWDDVMYPTILATSWVTSWYFISFIFVVTLLFTNLFVGVVLSVFARLSDKGDFSERDIERAISAEDDEPATAPLPTRKPSAPTLAILPSGSKSSK